MVFVTTRYNPKRVHNFYEVLLSDEVEVLSGEPTQEVSRRSIVARMESHTKTGKYRHHYSGELSYAKTVFDCSVEALYAW